MNPILEKIIVIGASTGGPQTIEIILQSLAADFPVPILIAQHMPKDIFMHSFVERLSKKTWIEVKIPENNEVLKPGIAYCLPSGNKCSLSDKKNQIRFQMEMENEYDLKCWPNFSPNIDFLLSSVVNIYKDNTIGVILSGMGDDGLQGMKLIKEMGGKTIVQDETALLFGMPKAVIDAGIADKILPIEKIPAAIKECLSL